MNTPTKLGAYAAGLAFAFAAATAVGATVGPVGAATSGSHDEHANSQGPGPMTSGHGSDGESTGPANESPGGLAVSQDGYTLQPELSTLNPGQPTSFRFTITGPDGKPVTRYTPEHDKDLHLILVRRDLSGFQHVHPTLGPDGVWSHQLTLLAAGDYRAFADFTPATDGARSLTLGVDLHAAGDYTPRPLPAPAQTATVEGYTVALTGELRAGASSALALTVSKDGQPVTNLEPYLAAYGHLVALRTGDLAYLHVHPEGAPGDGRTAAGPQIGFAAEVPTAGTYRLYLDFQHDGVVRTAEFTATATAGTGPASTHAATPAPSSGSGSDSHDH